MNLTSKREYLKKVYAPVGMAAARFQIPPNLITLASLILGSVSAYFFYHHKPFAGAVLLAISGILDLADGMVARLNDKASKFGAVFDWIADKWVDGLVLGSIGLAYSSPFIALLAVTSSMLHSFIKPVVYAEIGYSERIKGKIEDPLENTGFFGRPETHIAILVFSLFEFMKLPFGLSFGIKVITFLTLLSLMMRINYLFKRYGREYE